MSNSVSQDAIEPGHLDAEPNELTVEPHEQFSDGPQIVSFMLKNVGDAPVRIKTIDASCGCTAIDSLGNEWVNPGETVPLNVKVTFPAVGERQSRLVIHTDSAETPKVPIRLTLKGPPLEVPYMTDWPQERYFNTSQKGKLLEHELIVRAMESATEEPWLQALRSEFGSHTATFSPVSVMEDSGLSSSTVTRVYRFLLAIHAPHDVDDQAVTQLIPVFLRPDKTRVKPIYVVTTFTPLIHAVPRELFIQMNSQGTSTETNLLIVSQDSDSFRVSVISTEPWLKIDPPEFLEDDSSRIAKFKVRISRPTQQPDSVIRGMLSFAPPRPGMDSITVPVTVTVE